MCCVSVVASEVKEGTSVAIGRLEAQASLFRMGLADRGRKAAEELLLLREVGSGLVSSVQLDLPFA